MEDHVALIRNMLTALESDMRQVLLTTPSQEWLTKCMTNHIDSIKEYLIEYQAAEADRTRTPDALRDDVDALLRQGRDAIYEVQNDMKATERALDEVLYELETIG